jgi:hypothetical protein
MKTVTSISRLGARTGTWLAVVLAALGVLHCGTKETPTGSKAAPKQAPAASELKPPAVVSVAEVTEKGSDAINPDGKPFKPAKVFVGDRSGAAYEIDAGQVTVTGGKLTIHIGPMAGHDAVYDYVRLVTADGKETRVEAEDPATTGDRFSDHEGAEGHWWLQEFTAFSKGKGLVARKNKRVPVVTTVVRVPDGSYRLFIGSFKGDEAFGVYALGATWE